MTTVFFKPRRQIVNLDKILSAHSVANEKREWLDIIEIKIERQRSSLLFVQGQFEE